MSPPAGLRKLIVSAPFGNYVQPAGCTATLGTFTAARRPGRVRRVLWTVRYYRRLRAWVNKLGLRNPGMPWLVERVQAGKVGVADKIVSIHGFSDADWDALLGQVAEIRPLAVELNMSCPNVGCVEWPADLFRRTVATGVPVIVKVPPVNYLLICEQALESGVRMLHCCNTLPVPAGGLSGKPLKPVALQCIRDLHQRFAGAGNLTIIGGGGITDPGDIDDYASAGATHFAVGTKVFNPKYLFSHRALKPLVERAQLR